jgi:hypothetical protein
MSTRPQGASVLEKTSSLPLGGEKTESASYSVRHSRRARGNQQHLVSTVSDHFGGPRRMFYIEHDAR